jgi:hypothetical protein
MNHGDAENFMAYCQSHVFYVAGRSVSIRLTLCPMVHAIPHRTHTRNIDTC